MKEYPSGVAKISFLDLAFDPVSIDKTLSIVGGRGASEPFAYVVTPNVDHVVRLHAEKTRLMPLYEDAWLCLCDSKILQLLAKITRRNLPVVRGSDLTDRLFSEVINKGDTVCVIGGDDSVVDLLTASVGPDALSHYNPPMGFVKKPEEIEKCVAFIINNPSRYIFLAVGSPQQEIVARAVQQTGKATGSGFCIGASIDFLTGKECRAPKWMQKTGTEWLFRLLQDPKRMWRRYVLQGPKIILIFGAWQFSGAKKTHL